MKIDGFCSINCLSVSVDFESDLVELNAIKTLKVTQRTKMLIFVIKIAAGGGIKIHETRGETQVLCEKETQH